MPELHGDVQLRRVPLSVLDTAPVPSGGDASVALRNSLDLARHAEQLGYERYWVAEHHNMPGIASSSPPVLIGHIADVTSTIRVGAGGVMLPNHSPLAVAEQFGMLEALHPDRIDLALGRAPGTDGLTARALRRRPYDGGDDFPEQLRELVGYFQGTLPPEHPFAPITATPALGFMPPIWLLGSSGYSAQVAGMLGMPFAFAHHFSSANTLPALELYRSHFKASDVLTAPHAMVACAVICGEDDEHAEWLAGSGRLSFLLLRTGRPGQVPSPEEAAAYPFTDSELAASRSWTTSHVIGGPDTVRRGLAELLEATQADELIITTNVWSHTERLRSYERVMALFAEA